MSRSLIVFFAALICAFYFGVVALGYADLGSYQPLATYARVDAYRSRVVAVTASGIQAKLRVGDIVDTREMSLPQRLANFWGYWKAGARFAMPVHRQGHAILVQQPIVANDLRSLFILDVFQRLVLFGVGVLLIARGAGRPGLFGGLTLLFMAVANGYTVSFGNVPLAVGVTAFLIQSTATLFAAVPRYWFAMSLQPYDERKRTQIALKILFAVLLLAYTVVLILRRVEAFNGYSVSYSSNYLQAMNLLTNVYFVVLFGMVAARATGPNTSSMRIFFWSFVLGSTGSIVNNLYRIFGHEALPWDGALNLTFLFFAFGFAYAVFAKRLVAVNFYISKAAIFTIVLAVIIAVFVLLERLIEFATLSKAQSLFLELGVPLALGLSLKWIERHAERIVVQVLYREKLYAEKELEALICDFPHARDVDALGRTVVCDVHRLTRAPSVALYRESPLGYSPVAAIGSGTRTSVAADDRAFLRMRATQRAVEPDALGSELHAVLALPLVVVGKVTGALVLSARPNGERYDPDEITTLSKLAHELAITLVWAEREPLRVPALSAHSKQT
ncbi:MAG: GAF domain-containing protein [Candidatus Eremiobacteraeota bacterium]|nr:GAF domain-containing protein [Candidatus Eremiobacteraeota bacterium]